MRKVTNNKAGIRPVVSVKKDGDYYIVYEITSRNRENNVCVRMNHYKVHGFCEVLHKYRIHKTYMRKFIRDCTKSEIDAINKKRKSFGLKLI